MSFQRFQARSEVILLDFIRSPVLRGGSVHGRADVFLLLLMTFPDISVSSAVSLCLISAADYSPSGASDLMRELTELLLPSAAVIALGFSAAAGHITGWTQSAKQ